MDITLESVGDLFSLGKLSELMQRSPAEILRAAAQLNLKPLNIDCVPFWGNTQAEAIRVFLSTHKLKEKTLQQNAEAN
jgi:hypothetical protein